jgi:hypothetical protein
VLAFAGAPAAPATAARLLRRYSGLWIGPRREKIVYLAFDEANEFGTTRRIIGILDHAHIKASFFLTGTYICTNPGITRGRCGSPSASATPASCGASPTSTTTSTPSRR